MKMAKENKNEEAMVNEVVEVTAENTENEVVEAVSKRTKFLNGLRKFGPIVGVFGLGFFCGKKAGMTAKDVANAAEQVVEVVEDVTNN
jgi:hypothetical protein